MQTKFLYLIAIVLLGVSTPAPAQSEPGPFDGIQSSLNRFMDSAAEVYDSLKPKFDEYLRYAALLSSDIRMRMNATSPEDWVGAMSPGAWSPFLYMLETESEGSIYAEFDWQNQAQSMRVKSSESKTILGSPLGILEGVHAAQDFTMYIDAQNYWYVPTDDYGYIRINALGAMGDIARQLEFSIEAAIDAQVTEMLDELAELAIGELWNFRADGNDWLNDFIPMEIIRAYSIALENSGGSVTEAHLRAVEEKLKAVLEKLAERRHQQIEIFPALIHFAFIVSPTMARTQFNVREETLVWRGQNNCTKMTVVSGQEAGYQIVFDRYGRLIHLRGTDGATADYWYDRDVTVTIPPAKTIDFGKLMKPN